jgi:hypothetical protein
MIDSVSARVFILLKYYVAESPPFFRVASCALVFIDLARDALE